MRYRALISHKYTEIHSRCPYGLGHMILHMLSPAQRLHAQAASQQAQVELHAAQHTCLRCKVNAVHKQEHYLSRELELMLDRLESPAWNLANQSEQASLAQAPTARVPLAYHPKVGPLSPPPRFLPTGPPHSPLLPMCSRSYRAFTLPLGQRSQCEGTSGGSSWVPSLYNSICFEFFIDQGGACTLSVLYAQCMHVGVQQGGGVVARGRSFRRLP